MVLFASQQKVKWEKWQKCIKTIKRGKYIKITYKNVKHFNEVFNFNYPILETSNSNYS